MLDWSEFDRLMADMDIPELRRRDTAWLLRNLHIRNSNHLNFHEAREELVRMHRLLRRVDL